MTHKIRVGQSRRVDGSSWWYSVCSCSRYSSGLCFTEQRAVQAGTDHVNALNKRQESTVDARQKLIEAVYQALDNARCSGDPDQLEQYAQDVVAALLSREEGRMGWLMIGYSGQVVPLIEVDFRDTGTWMVWGSEYLEDDE